MSISKISIGALQPSGKAIGAWQAEFRYISSIQTGNWSSADTWQNGTIPESGDRVVVNHNITLDCDAYFYSLDNNAIITKDASHRTLTIDDSGLIDNTGGIISCANNGNITFKASVGTTPWTWGINTGTWTDGSGEHHFANGRLTVNAGFVIISTGSYHFDDDMQFDGSTANDYIHFYDPVTFAAGKVFTLGDGVNDGFYIQIRDLCTANGSVGNRITFDGNSQTGSFQMYNNNTVTASITYCDFTDICGFAGCYPSYWTGGSLTMNNCNFYSNQGAGLRFGNILTGSAVTVTDCNFYSNSTFGVYMAGAGSLVLEDCNFYSNTTVGYWINGANSDGCDLTRCKIYSNGAEGIYGNIATKTAFELVDCLVYENTNQGYRTYYTDGTSKILNCTFADNSATLSNIYSYMTTDDALAITNTIVSGAKYGINGAFTVDPTVTYSDVYGATTSNYFNMTDPTGSAGNISVDPVFTDPDNDDYSLQRDTSPCFNTGTTGATTDIDNLTFCINDMGCYRTLDTVAIVAGNWSTVGTWDNGVPVATKWAGVYVAVTLNDDVAFANLYNRDTITKDASHRTLTIDDSGLIDNTGGIISCANNGNITFKASVGTTPWTWGINTGTWTDGSGEHHFENGHLTVSDDYLGFNSGSYYFDEDMQFDSSVDSKYIQISTSAIFAADKVFTLSDGTNKFWLSLTGVVTCNGGSGTEITLDGNNNEGYFSMSTGSSGSITYTDMVDFTTNAFEFTGVDLSGVTVNNISITGFASDGLAVGGFCTNSMTVSDSSFTSCGQDAISYDSGVVNVEDCTFTSNTGFGVYTNVATGGTIDRCKFSANGYGVRSAVGGNSSLIITSSLIYESSVRGVYIENTTGTSAMINCTITDSSASYANAYINLEGAEVFPVTNCIIEGAKYGINSAGAVDPVVTYSDVYGAATANYQSMTDPTGSAGNISVDPEFVDAASDDYDLKWTSPCLNAGTSTGAPATDIDSDSWINSNPDMGCYTQEYIIDTSLIKTLGSGDHKDLTDVSTINVDVRASRTGTNFKIKLHDSGGTITEREVNIDSADTFQTETWDISGVANADKDDINKITVEIINGDVTNDIYIDNFYVQNEISDITLISESFTAEEQPEDARIILFEEDVDAVTINTDLKAFVSRDAGITWSEVTLSDEGNYETAKRVLSGTVDISGQPAGTTVKYKVTSHNNKEFKLHGASMLWS